MKKPVLSAVARAPFGLTAAPTLLALACLAWTVPRAHASDDAHAAPAKPAKAASAHAASGKLEAKGEGKADAKGDAKTESAHGADAQAPAREAVREPKEPLEVLRQRLQQKLGAVSAPAPRGATQAPAMQVTSRSGEFQVTPGRLVPVAARSGGHGRDKPAAGHGADAGGGHDKPHWSYQGEGGPENWSKLATENLMCALGKRQSPIDIRDGFPADLEPIGFDYRDSNFTVVNNGHTLQVNLGSGNRIEVGGRRYELVQFHFHHPAEERINGRSFDMVAHLVHKDPEGRLAVVAVLMNRGNVPQPVIQNVWNNLPLEQSQPVQARGTLDPSALLPEDRRYFTYMGSLTTPPCTEGVLWLVLKQPVSVTMSQIDFFARLYPMNARPIQSAAGRIIKQSN